MSIVFDDSNNKIFAVTCSYKRRNYGMVIAWLVRASLDAKKARGVLVLSKYNDTANVLLKKKKFAISLLNEKQIPEFFLLGSRHSKDFDKFEHIKHIPSATYGPVVSGCLAYTYCTVLNYFETSDRYILHVEVDKEATTKRPAKPMILKEAFKKLSRSQRAVLDVKYKSDSKRDAAFFRDSLR